MVQLTILDAIPDGLLDTSARDLHRLVDGPTLIELEGVRGAPLFVSVLMHGNEDSGLVAIQKVLRQYVSQPLPRPLMILLGNVAAASEGRRRLDHQPDYNRVWPGCVTSQDSEEAQVMAQIHHRVIERKAFAAIDIHNNTGRNPHYGVVCVEDPKVMQLAALFAPRAVLFRGLPGTQTASFSGLVPALTIECGQPGVEANAQAAAQLVLAALSLPGWPALEGDRELALFHTLVQVKVGAEIALDRSPDAFWLDLVEGLDLSNFERLPSGFEFGATNHPMPLEAIDERGDNVVDSFFEIKAGKLTLKQSVVPAMLTADERVIRQDCLCYLMEELRP